MPLQSFFWQVQAFSSPISSPCRDVCHGLDSYFSLLSSEPASFAITAAITNTSDGTHLEHRNSPQSSTAPQLRAMSSSSPDSTGPRNCLIKATAERSWTQMLCHFFSPTVWAQ